MSKPNIININDLLGINEDENNVDETNDREVTELNISDLIPFKNHPFKLYEGERLNDMVESIKEHGIIVPLIVRALKNDTYEILSGHNRVSAAKLAGLKKVPVVIKDGLTEEEAMLIVTETNLIQRSFSELSHSEKARILTERHNAIKDQGKRTDLRKGNSKEKQRKLDLINEIEMMSNIDGYGESSNFRQFGENHRTDEEVASSYDLSPRNVSRYLRVDMLIDELKTRLDNNEIPFIAGVDLSYLKEEEQETVEDILTTYGFKIDLKKSDVLKTLSQGKNFTYNKAHDVLSGKYFDKPKKSKKPKFSTKFINNIFKKYFNENQSINEVEELIDKLLEEHFSQNHEIEDTKEFEVE